MSSITEHNKMIFKKDTGFDFPQFYDFYEKTVASVWRHQEVAMDADLRDWSFNSTPDERAVIAGILKGFVSAELGIGCYWADEVCRIFPKPEIQAMARAFSFFETIHAAAYSYLNDVLGLNEYEEFINDPIACSKIETFFQKYSDKVSLAVFSGAGEGVSLFSSFAVLLSFNKDGRYKGLAQIISWSAIDEQCVDAETEFLTPSGWKKISAYTPGDKVAQFDPSTKQVNFVTPIKYIKNKSSELYRLGKSRKWSQVVTPGHTMVDYKEGTMEIRKNLAKDWSARQSYVPVAGYLSDAPSLTALDRFAIALQADGSVRAQPSKREVTFNFKRARKIERFRQLAAELSAQYGFKVSERLKKNKDGFVTFSLLVPDEYLKYRTKFFDEIYSLDSVPLGFIEELQFWDGHKPSKFNTDAIYYSSKELRNVEFVQAVASLSGYYGHIFRQDDTRWKKLCRQHRIYLKRQDAINARNSSKELVKLNSEEDVFCFKVPTQAFLTRRDGLISVTGNCHSEAGCELFRELVAETGLTDEDREAIYDGFRLILQKEFAFVDHIFNSATISSIDAEELKAYITNRANERLLTLGLEQIFKLTTEELSRAKSLSSWFDPMVQGQSNADFFAHQKNGSTYVAKPAQDFMSVDVSTLDLDIFEYA